MRKQAFSSIGILFLTPTLLLAAPNTSAVNLDDLLSRTSAHVTKLVNQFSNVQCIERV